MKIRRLYDVSKVLITIGLIKQIYDNKRSTLEWLGVSEMTSKLNLMVKNSFARLWFSSEKKGNSSNSSMGSPSMQSIASSIPKYPLLPSDYLVGKRLCIDPFEAEEFIEKSKRLKSSAASTGV